MLSCTIYRCNAVYKDRKVWVKDYNFQDRVQHVVCLNQIVEGNKRNLLFSTHPVKETLKKLNQICPYRSVFKRSSWILVSILWPGFYCILRELLESPNIMFESKNQTIATMTWKPSETFFVISRNAFRRELWVETPVWYHSSGWAL